MIKSKYLSLLSKAVQRLKKTVFRTICDLKNMSSVCRVESLYASVRKVIRNAGKAGLRTFWVKKIWRLRNGIRQT